MKTVVVPLDRSSTAEQALPMARNLAEQAGASIVLLSVLDVPREFAAWAEGKSNVDALLQHQTEDETYLEDIAASFDPGIVETMVLAGNPALEIVNLAARLDAPVIVMASHGRTGMRHFILGSVTARVVQAATCPVLVVNVRGDEAPPPITRPISNILVPLDGSDFAERALKFGLATLQSVPVHIHLLRVVEPPTWYMSGAAGDDYVSPNLYEQFLDSVNEEAESYLARIESELANAGHQVTSEIVDGMPIERICSAAQKHNVELVVMATHGRTGIRRFVMGSVAEGVLHRAVAPVLLVSPLAGSLNRQVNSEPASVASNG